MVRTLEVIIVIPWENVRVNDREDDREYVRIYDSTIEGISNCWSKGILEGSNEETTEYKGSLFINNIA